MGHLSDLLEKNRARYKRAVIVTESIFSMDGDRCELQELVRLKNRYEALLYIDEAHGVGALGKKGKGLAEEKNLIGDIDILMGTFGKALGGLGAYAVFDGVLKDYLINKMRPFIFTTGLPPVQLHWNRFVLKKIHAMQKQRAHLHDLSRKLRALIREKGFETRGDTHIVPLIVGKNDETGKWADAFQKAGILVFGIRPPTVPAGTSRLRFSLTANLGEEDLSKIETVLKGNRS
jgi:8-amino-7-oxononanoate synthase